MLGLGHFNIAITIDGIIEDITKGGIWLILPPVAPFIRDYYNALSDAKELINQSA